MAADASLGHSTIRINGPEITLSSFRHKSGMGFCRMIEDKPQASLLKIV